MALELKCDLYLNNNEIVVYDTSGWYSSTNLTGWNSDAILSGTNSKVNDILNINLKIDTISINIENGVNELILPCDFTDIVSPGDLIFTINSNTYSTYYQDFGSFTDGIHTIVYTVNTSSGSYSYTTTIFTYKEVEEDMWNKFWELASSHTNLKLGDKIIDQSLFLHSLYKGLEFSSRTSVDNAKSLEILETFKKILDFNNCKSC